MDFLINARQLSCERGGVSLFNGIDFSLASGEVLQVVGPNGSGKTTLLRILATLGVAYEGTLSWNDYRLLPGDENYLSRLLYIGHKTAIKDSLTPFENLRWYVGRHRDDDIHAALTGWKVDDCTDKPCYQLSAGQKQRVALARLLLSEKSFWILDEPFTAIDQAGVLQLESLMSAHAKKGGTVLLTTHHALRMTEGLRYLPLQQVTD